MEYIKIQLPETEILAQLAEEASELAQAALKLRRAIEKRNPTIVSEEMARENLCEEYGDVLNCIEQILTTQDLVDCDKNRNWKLARWAERLVSQQNKR